MGSFPLGDLGDVGPLETDRLVGDRERARVGSLIATGAGLFSSSEETTSERARGDMPWARAAAPPDMPPCAIPATGRRPRGVVGVAV